MLEGERFSEFIREYGVCEVPEFQLVYCYDYRSHPTTVQSLDPPTLHTMAAVYSSVYYDCLKDLQKDITNGITQTEVNIDRLTEKAKKKGLLPSRHSMRPDSAAPRGMKVATFVFSCTESVKQNEKQFHSFLAVLGEVGLEHLVRRIQRKLEQGGDQKPVGQTPKRSKVPPPYDDSGTVSASVSQSLPPLHEVPTTLTSHQSPFHNEGGPRQLDRQRRSRSAATQRLKSMSEYGAEKEASLQPLISPNHSRRSSIDPVEETQEGGTEGVMMVNMQQIRLRSEDLIKNLMFEKQQVEAGRAQTQRLSKDNETLKKQLEEKQKEIYELQAKYKNILREKEEKIKGFEEKMGKDKKEREKLKLRTAELERQLEQKDRDNEELRKDFSKKTQEIRNQHEREVDNLKKQLLEEKAKAELEIKDLNNRILSKEVEKLQILDKYKDRERELQSERDTLKVELAELRQSITEEKYRTLQQEKIAAEQEYLALIEELQKQLGCM